MRYKREASHHRWTLSTPINPGCISTDTSRPYLEFFLEISFWLMLYWEKGDREVTYNLLLQAVLTECPYTLKASCTPWSLDAVLFVYLSHRQILLNHIYVEKSLTLYTLLQTFVNMMTISK